MTSSIRSCLHKPQHNCSNTRNTLPRGRLTRPRGPILGARADVAPTSPPVHLRYTGRSKTINASVGGVGGALRTIPVSMHRFGAGHATFSLFSKPLQDPPRRAEAGTPLPAAIALSVGRSKRHVGQRPSVQLRLPRPTPSRRGRSRTASQLSGQGPGDKPYPKACGLQSRHRSSGPPSPFTRGEAKAQKE